MCVDSVPSLARSCSDWISLSSVWNSLLSLPCSLCKTQAFYCGKRSELEAFLERKYCESLLWWVGHNKKIVSFSTRRANYELICIWQQHTTCRSVIRPFGQWSVVGWQQAIVIGSYDCMSHTLPFCQWLSRALCACSRDLARNKSSGNHGSVDRWQLKAGSRDASGQK